MAFVYHYIGPYAYGANFQCGVVGGAQTHALTAEQLPKLTGSIALHSSSVGTPVYYCTGVFSAGQENSSGYKDGGTYNTGARSAGEVRFSVGGGAAHNNMPPYIAQNIIVRAL